MSDEAAKIEIKRGLKEVYFDRSRVCDIDGKAGELRYRGYSIHDLAEHSSFEAACYLLVPREPPSRAQPAAFAAELRAARTLPPAVLQVIEHVKSGHPMDVLR